MRTVRSAVVAARRRLTKAPIGLGIAIFLTSFTIALFSFDWAWQTYQQNKSQESEHYQTLYTGPIWIGLRSFWHWLEANDKPLLVIFTTGLFYFTYKLWDSTRALVEGAEITSHQELRAYIGCSAPEPVGKFPNVFRMALKNAGQTPARNIRGHLNRYRVVPPGPLPHGFTYPNFEEIPTKLGVPLAGGEALTIEFPANEAEFTLAQEGKISLYVYGNVLYLDVFGESCETTFSYLYSGRWVGQKVAHMMTVLADHNDIK
jgi:hypothetical protein